MKSLQTLGLRVTWLHAQNLGDCWDEAGSIAQGEARVCATRSQAMIPFQFEQQEGKREVFTFSESLRLWQPGKNAFPGALPGPADPA